MTRIAVPYHIDEHLPGLDLPFAPDTTITSALPDADTWSRLATLYGPVARAVASAAELGERPVVMSGDCTTSLGTVAGLQQAGLDPAIVWFDGHGDVQTMETTSSGYLGGMPLRILVGYRPELIANHLGLRAVPPERVVLVDARDLDPPEREFLAEAPIRRCGVEEVGADELPDGPLYLHLDLDVVNPDELPGLLFPAQGGPGLAGVARAVRQVIDTGRVAAFGIGCTWHPGRAAAARVRPHLESAVAALA